MLLDSYIKGKIKNLISETVFISLSQISHLRLFFQWWIALLKTAIFVYKSQPKIAIFCYIFASRSLGREVSVQ